MNKMAYWQCFSAIESELVAASRYVEIAKHNQNTFSIGFAHVILSAGSEIDVACRLLRGLSDQHSNMNKHRDELTDKYPRLNEMHVLVPRSGWRLRPWKAWKDGKNPPWWKTYNNVKHHRHEHFKDATLGNALDALGGLLCLLLYYYREERISGLHLVPPPNLLSTHECPQSVVQGEEYGPLPDF